MTTDIEWSRRFKTISFNCEQRLKSCERDEIVAIKVKSVLLQLKWFPNLSWSGFGCRAWKVLSPKVYPKKLALS